MSAASNAARAPDPVPSSFVIRRLPAPACEPPYDDELPEGADRTWRSQAGDGVQGILALSFTRLPAPTTTVTSTAKILRLVTVPTTPPGNRARRGRARTRRAGTPGAGSQQAGSQQAGSQQAGTQTAGTPTSGPEDDLDLTKRQPVRTGRDQLPDPQPWAHGFVQALTEVMGGFRPLGQLTARAIPGIITQVVECRAVAAAAPTRQRPVVRSVRVSEPMPGAVEVSATVRHGERCRALALRLEGLDGRWQCTELILG